MLQKLKALFTKKNTSATECESKYNQLWELYDEGKLENPYFFLCDYQSGVNGEGHSGFFFNVENVKENELKIYVEELKKVLPKDLYDNFYQAYQVWLDGNDEQSENACSVADDYFYRNESRIIEILQQYADTL